MDNPKVIVDDRVQNLVPFLPLGEMNRPAQPQPTPNSGAPSLPNLGPRANAPAQPQK